VVPALGAPPETTFHDRPFAMTDTIVALATPSGEGGIAIVRLSGTRAISIADSLFRAPRRLADAPTHTLLYGRLALNDSAASPGSGVFDEVLVSVMRAPRSYTREDVVEINCHGGIRLADEVIRACVSLGARRAERGEFTERAFLNGRLDLAQAEAVLDLVKARTKDALSAAYYELNGGLSARINALRDRLTASLARIETGLEFDEEDLGVGDPRAESAAFREILSEISALVGTYARGRLIAEGASVAIIGPPNVGKSSLLNAILGEDRAIVSHIPGTTRDLVEGEADLDGVRVRFVDTAGLRETGDAVEREGTKRAGRAASAADVVLLVCDGSGEIPWDLTPVSGRNAIIVINKMDKARNEVLSVLSASAGSTPVFRVSALSGEGLDTLCRGIRETLCADAPEPKTGGVIIRARHADALSAAGSHLERALDEATGQARSELVAADIRLALDALGSITGETTPEDIIRRIFSEFCVGK